MTQNDFFNSWVKGFDAFDIQDVLESQRKTMKSFAQVQQIASQNIQEIASKQTDLFSRIMKQNTDIAQDLMSAGKAEEKLERNSKAFQESCAQIIESVQDIAALVQKTNSETAGILSKRAQENIKEFQNQSANKTSSAA